MEVLDTIKLYLLCFVILSLSYLSKIFKGAILNLQGFKVLSPVGIL
jgi:hypothetical protein